MFSSFYSLSSLLIGVRTRLWNYNPFNNNTHGDYWNGENFSLFSRDSKSREATDVDMNVQQVNENLDDGGRILRAIVRPYPAKTAGVPTKFDSMLSDNNNYYYYFAE